ADVAARQLVDPTRGSFPGAFHVYRLLDLGSDARTALPLRSISFSLLFTGAVWRSAAILVRHETGVDPGVGHRRDADSVGAWRVSRDVLLLPRRILQGLLGGPSVLCGG